MVIKPPDNCNFTLAEIVQKVSHYKQFNLRIGKSSDKQKHNSAVLVPLVLHNGQVAMLYTLRSNSLERHSGQVSFPGGVIEESDQSAIETALRETEEEIGVGKQDIQVIGQLHPFDTSTGFIVFPVIGMINSLDQLTRNSVEVDRIFCIPLSWLCDPRHSKLKVISGMYGKLRRVWYYDLYEGELLWGITAKITKDFLELIKK